MRATTTDSPSAGSRMPPWLVAIEAAYLGLLLAAGAIYATVPHLRLLPTTLGPFPLGVAYFGALGAVTAGIFGIYFHNVGYQPSYTYWYVFRPMTGIVLGLVAYMIFVVVIQSTGTEPRRGGALIYYLVAFLVGYREHVFQDLIQRAVDFLLAPGTSANTTGSSPPLGPRRRRR